MTSAQHTYQIHAVLMNKIVLEDRFTTHQKITFLLYIGAPFIICIFALLKSAINSHLNSLGYLILMLFLLIYFFLISIAFLKRGFAKINSKLYKASFFRDTLIFKKEIDISKTPKLAILKFKKSQKFAWFSIAKPDLATDYDTFEINFLNENHTKREQILDLKNKNNIDPTIAFLTANFNLTHEIYSPDFG